MRSRDAPGFGGRRGLLMAPVDSDNEKLTALEAIAELIAHAARAAQAKTT